MYIIYRLYICVYKALVVNPPSGNGEDLARLFIVQCSELTMPDDRHQLIVVAWLCLIIEVKVILILCF